MTWSVATPTCVAPSCSMVNSDWTTPRVAPISTPSLVEMSWSRRVVLPEDLVGAVDKMNDHVLSVTQPLDRRCCRGAMMEP